MSSFAELGGVVLPAFMRARQTPTNRFYEKSFNDTTLKIGVVTGAHAPSDDANVSKTVWEYDVQVTTSSGAEISRNVTYHGCRMQTGFGGLADKFLWAPLVQVFETDAQGNPTTTMKTPGSTVLIECVQGFKNYPIILGAIAPIGSTVEPDDIGDGAHGTQPVLHWQYNGIRADINQDGELTIQRRGPTKADGSYVNAAAADPPINAFDELNDIVDDTGCNALFMLAKDGTITLQSGNTNDSLVIDPKDNVTLTADMDLTLASNKGSGKISAQQGVEISDGIGATATIANGTFKFEANGIELIQQVLNVIQALQSATVMTMMGPQPLDPLTLSSLIQAQINIQLIKG